MPPIKRFTSDDFAGISTIAAFSNKLFYPLNLFLNATYQALSNGLTLNANTIGQVVQSTAIKADANGLATTTVNWRYPQSPPLGVVVMNCALNTTTPALFPMISWSYNAGVVTITMQFVKSSGGAIVVSASNTYNLTFYISGG